MKKFVWDNGIGFVGGGLLAMGISSQQGLSPFQIGLISVGVGIACMVISHFFYLRIKKFSRPNNWKFHNHCKSSH